MKHKLSLALFLLVYMFFSCQKEDFQIRQTENPPLIKSISLEPFDSLIRNSYKVVWSDTIKENADASRNLRRLEGATKVMEFPIQLEGYLTFEDDSLSAKVGFSLIVEKDDSLSERHSLIKFIPFGDSTGASQFSYLNIGDFTGTVYRYSSAGEVLSIEGYEQGELKASLPNGDLPSDSATWSHRMQPDPICCLDDGGGGGYFITVTVYNYTDWYVSVNGGPFRYSGSDYRGSTSYSVWVPKGTSNSSTPKHEHSPSYKGGDKGSTTAASPHPKDVIFTRSFEGTIAKCIYEKLIGMNTLKKFVQRFDGSFPVAHLQWATADLDDHRRAITSPPKDYIITITLNNDNSNNGLGKRPALLTAKTIIHEVIHAEMFRKLLSLANNSGSINVNTLNNMLAKGDYPGILDYYVRFGVNGFQHQQMAQHYRETIAGALQEYDNNQRPWQFYMDLAWEGLDKEGISAWDTLSGSEKQRIRKVISDFILTGSKACN